MGIEQISPTSESESVEKNEAWRLKQQEIEQIEDLLGRGIDDGIKEAVIAFNMNDLSTSNSCEGHVERGLPYPFVQVEAEDEPRWHFEGQKELFEQVAQEKNIALNKIERDSDEWDLDLYIEVDKEMWNRINTLEKQEKIEETQEYQYWKEENKKMFEKAQTLYDEYKNTLEAESVDPDTEIVMEGSGESDFVFRPQSGFKKSIDGQRYLEENETKGWSFSQEEKKELEEKIEKRRASMQHFTDFLREKYFSS